MAVIVKGTTPTITYTFSTVRINEVTQAVLTLKHRTGMITKTLSDATIGENSLTWTLTQEDTLSLQNEVSMMLNFVCTDGTRGASDKTSIAVKTNHINEVI